MKVSQFQVDLLCCNAYCLNRFLSMKVLAALTESHNGGLFTLINPRFCCCWFCFKNFLQVLLELIGEEIKVACN